MSESAERTRVWAVPSLLAAFAVCAAAALWISNGVGLWDGDTRSAWHHYEYLAEGFARGHTYLSLEPDPELLALRDPYDSSANTGHKLWDASLYRGKYYLYFGPAPAVLMAAWRMVTGHVPPQRLAVAAAALADLAALALLLSGFRRRYFPRLSPLALGGILVVAFHASWLPVLLRRSAVWELPIVAAVAFLAWAIYFLWRFHESGGKARWALAGGVAVSFLVASRATYLFSAGAVTLLYFVPVAQVAGLARGIRRTALLTVLVAVAGGLGLLAYNHARFGGWLDFGQRYQLWGADERQVVHFSPSYAPFNAWTYIFSLPQFGPYFPFVHPFAPEVTPRGYIKTEDIYGFVYMLPVQLAGFAACAWAWRSRSDPAKRPAVVAVAAAAVSSALSALLLFTFGGACSRYTAELLGGWTLATAVGLASIFGSAEGARPGRLARTIAALAALWTVACVWLACAEYRGYMKLTNPRAYGALAHALDFPAEWRARAMGVEYGPVDLVVALPPTAADTRTVLVASGRPEMVNYLLVERTRDGQARFILAWNEHYVIETPPIAAHGEMRLRIDAPWLYPPTEDPYWDAVPEPARGNRQSLFAIAWDGGNVRIHSPHFADPVAFEPNVLGPAQAGPGSPAVVSMQPAGPPP
jgi:hypothetical protein